MHFADRLQQAIDRTGNPCVVGIDPILDLLPQEYASVREPDVPRAERANRLATFCCEVIDLAAGVVPAVKPQSAFFEVFGADGARAWERVVDCARAAGLIVIGDVKRGDIATTAEAYATAFLDGLDPHSSCDAITLNPLLGADSIEPFVRVCARTGRGLYILVRTSNPGSADFQRHGEPELSHRIAERVEQWGSALVGASGLSSIGAVVGATHGAELARFRALLPRTPLLLPGYGAQGATAQDIVGAFLPATDRAPRGALVNSSRAILFASRDKRYAGKPWKDASRAALDAMIADVSGALMARR